MAVDTIFVVRSTHLNHEGHLFGGDLMAAIDEVGYCEAREAAPNCRLVTRAAEIQFVNPARLGDVVHFRAETQQRGTTSLVVTVTGRVDTRIIGTAKMIYVCIDAAGRKTPLT